MANSNLTYNRGKTNVRVSKFFQKVFLDQKLNNWLGFLIIGLIACFIGYLMAEQTKFGLGLTGLIAGLAVVIVCMSNAETGLYIILIYSFFISHFNRLFFDDSLPVGVFSDILIGATFLGFLIRQVNLKKKYQ